jgi:hypothetical protein
MATITLKSPNGSGPTGEDFDREPVEFTSLQIGKLNADAQHRDERPLDSVGRGKLLVPASGGRGRSREAEADQHRHGSSRSETVLGALLGICWSHWNL